MLVSVVQVSLQYAWREPTTACTYSQKWLPLIGTDRPFIYPI